MHSRALAMFMHDKGTQQLFKSQASHLSLIDESEM
jgi:hypothetical protein